MIDLHIKSRLSTGEMSVFRLLETVNASNISYFSIADKNHCLAYKLFDLEDYPKLITGVSINTYYKGMPLDIIGYDVDVELINEWYDKTYPQEKIEWIERDRARQIVRMLRSKSYEVEEECSRYDKLGSTSKEIFARLIDKYPDFVYKNERDFRLYGLNNPDSEYYVNQTAYLPNIDVVINLIKVAGGKSFLAHPFEYRSDVRKLLEMVLDKDIDGVEVYHASISVLNSLTLIEFCENTNKLASIGSGFTGDNQLIPLGVYLDEEILEKDCFSWIFNR